MKPDVQRFSAAELIRFVSSLFVSKGMSAAQASTLAEVIVWADQRGISSHGVGRLAMYMRIIADGHMDPHAEPVIEDRAGALFIVEGNHCAGPVAMKMAFEEAAKRARIFGVSIAAIRGTTHTGAIGYYAFQAAEQNFCGIMMNGGQPNMAYHGARVKALATAPLAIGVPSGEGPLVLDMATASIANGRLQQAVANGNPIPPGCALTKDGEPTTDAAAAEVLLPLGGPKGSGMSFMFECLTGVLAANPVIASMIGPNRKVKHAHNAMLILIDIAAMRPLADFKRDMSELGAAVKALPRLDPDVEIMLPGERGAREFARRAREGIPLSAKTLAGLQAIAEKAGVAPLR